MIGEMRFETPAVLVLGAGGIVGEAWMGGVLAGLGQATGFDPRDCKHFVGTSAGSIVAAGLAGGVDPASRLEQLPEQPAAPVDEPGARSLFGGALRFGRGAGATAFAPLASLALRSTAFSGAAVRRAALARVPAGRNSLDGLGREIAKLGLDWDGRLLVVAVEVESGRRVVFGTPDERQLSVPSAVEASCAIPGVFRPISSGGRTYLDGGAWSLTNLDVAPVSEGTRVLCLNPTGSLGAMPSLRGAVGPLSRSVAAVESLSLQRRGAIVSTLAPDAEAARAMGADFMDRRRRGPTQQAGFAQALRAGAEIFAAV
jgi:NTE family protein